MKYLLLFLVLCAVFERDVLAKRRHKPKHHPKKSHHQKNHHHKNHGGKIVGGTEVSIKDYSYMAYLFVGFEDDDDGFECGGSILSSKYILSAAHCFEDDPTEIVATIGTNNKFEGGHIYDGTYTIHEKYDSESLDYDIAFFTADREMHLDGVHSKAIILIEEGTSIPSGTMLKISGWGDTSEGGDDSDVLLATEVPSISNEECNDKPNAEVNERQFCGGYEKGGQDHCEVGSVPLIFKVSIGGAAVTAYRQTVCLFATYDINKPDENIILRGDSGGPAVIADSNILAGVVSGSFGDCAEPHTPGFYVNLTNPAIRSWISEKTGI